jgi:hypothetical protein
MSRDIPETIKECFSSPNVPDRNMEPANVVDAVDSLSRSIDRLAINVSGGCLAIAKSLDGIATAIRLGGNSR